MTRFSQKLRLVDERVVLNLIDQNWRIGQLYGLIKLILGEVKINPGNGLIFNVTPSPGASACLANAWLDLTSLGFWLGFEANVARLDDVEFS